MQISFLKHCEFQVTHIKKNKRTQNTWQSHRPNRFQGVIEHLRIDNLFKLQQNDKVR